MQLSAKPNDQNLERLLYEFDENFKKLSICDDDEFIDKYTELAEAIVKYDSTNCLNFLLKYFNDNDEGYNELYWLQDSLKNVIESIDDELYVIGFLKNLHLMFPNAKSWAMYLLNRILNNPYCNTVLIANKQLADQSILAELLSNRTSEI